ncbi:hypothetical protein FPV67DRAFT_597242 [Lyophyllum atratum]|nr:hypothetical protein FPV67DRAFT_597242 [Lyophyllum atratum]
MQRKATLLSPTPSPPPHSSTTPDLPPPDSLGELHAGWLLYLDSCMYQWRILFAVAGFFFCTAPTVFQIQGASEDPLPRTLAFLAVFRAIVGLVYAPAFLHYFGERSEARSLEFAVLWTRETRTREGERKCGPWILLSLPATATLWAMVLYALSMLAFIWRVGAVGDPVDGGRTPLSEPAAYVLRAVLTGATVVDVMGGVWAWRRMAWFTREVRAMRRRR